LPFIENTETVFYSQCACCAQSTANRTANVTVTASTVTIKCHQINCNKNKKKKMKTNAYSAGLLWPISLFTVKTNKQTNED